MEYSKIIESIEQNPVYIEILKDSCRGVCYFKTKNDYDAKTLKPLFMELKSLNLLNSIDGVMLGVYHFLELEKVKIIECDKCLKPEGELRRFETFQPADGNKEVHYLCEKCLNKLVNNYFSKVNVL